MENENRLIYVEDIYKYAINGLREGWLNCEDYDVIVQAADESPTADAVEVVRGRWIDDRTNIICSNCKAEYSDEIIFMNRNFKYENLNYCPSCGALMDGDTNV